MTDLESRLHHAIGLAQSLVKLGRQAWPFRREGISESGEMIESALRAAVEEIRELRADRERMDWLFSDWDDESIVLVKMSDSKWAVCFGNEPHHEGASIDGRDAIDAARAQAEGGGDE